MYLVPSSLWQAVMGAVGSSEPVPCKLAAVVQSRFANAWFTASETPATGVATVDVSEDAGIPRPDARTCRKRSSAVWPTRSTTRRPFSPGTEITI